MNVVTEYKGIKYSLRSRGLKSRVLCSLSAFVVAFGGVLLVAMPASADPDPSPTPEVSIPPTTPTPEPTVVPTKTPEPPPIAPPGVVTKYITVTKTVVITKTIISEKPVYVTETKTNVIEPPGPTPAVLGESAFPETTPSPPATRLASESSSLGWVAGLVAFVGVCLLVGGLVGTVVRRRRYQGSHAVKGGDTQVMPTYTVSDYNPNLYDDGATVEFDPVSEELPEVKDTKAK